MRPRLNPLEAILDAIEAMQTLAHCGAEPGLLKPVKLHACQINGCAFGIDIHTSEARARGRPP
jgi:alkylhydroperoxidase family enzyme